MSDTSKGFSLGGLLGSGTANHFQAESFLNFNVLGKKWKLQPSLVYMVDEATQFPALMFRISRYL